MRLAILTTETPHHAYFVREVARHLPEVVVLQDARRLTFPFATAHPYESERDTHETEHWFGGREARLADFAETRRFSDGNGADAQAFLRRQQPDMGIVFGTGRLDAAMIEIFRSRLLNLHGGPPEEYRGLDTHLWAIYHGDWGALSACLHEVAPELDTGRIVSELPVPLAREMPLAQLRRSNTEVGTRLFLDALAAFQRDGTLFARPQRQVGRYYSAMPSVLKDICVRKFARYSETLPCAA